MAKLSLIKRTELKIGFTPEANKVNRFTLANEMRDGVHVCRKIEFASLNDLIRISMTYAPGKTKMKNGVDKKKWFTIIKASWKEDVRLHHTEGHYLETDEGDVLISKGSHYETYFVALPDYPKYLGIVAKHQPRIAKRLLAGWLATVEKSSTYNF